MSSGPITHIEIVRPLDSNRESFYVFATIGLVLIIAIFVITLRSDTTEKKRLLPHQMNAFMELSPDELAIYQDLYSAALEIDSIHDDNEGTWLNVRQLEGDYIAPFVKDLSWRSRGEIEWIHVLPELPNQHTAIYFGKSQMLEKPGTFLLIMSHRHDDSNNPADQSSSSHEEQDHITIWYDASNALSFDGKFKEEYLIAQGWKEIIAYRGEEELSRLKRGGRE